MGFSLERKDIDVPLTQEEIRQRNRVFGDFANMNRQINKERSDATHKRIQENPIYLIEYHRQMREAKNEWGGIIPVQIIAEKIKDTTRTTIYEKTNSRGFWLRGM
jgi:hypothetical protein